MEEQTRGTAAGGAGQSPTCETRQREEPSAATWRTGGTQLRPCVRQRRSQTKLVTGDRRCEQTIPDGCRSPQFEPLGAKALGNRQTKGLAGPLRASLPSVSCQTRDPKAHSLDLASSPACQSVRRSNRNGHSVGTK